MFLDNSSLSNTLQYVNLSGVSDEECKITYGGQITENMACFEGSYNEGTCFVRKTKCLLFCL